MEDFKRPRVLHFPTIWVEFISASGRKYWIQDIPDEYKDVVANYMVYGFVKDEPLFKSCFASTYPKFLISARKFWKREIDQNLSLVCLTKNDNGDVQIAGANCMYVVRDKVEDDKPVEKSPTSKVLETHIHMAKKADPFNKLKIGEYLKGMGLYVLPEFRGEGVGLELLKAREPLSKALGLKTTCTVFTSIFSQTIAEKAGFKDLYVISYEELA